MSNTGPKADRPPNRLAASSSPYLLQHGHNPVDWWPWGPEAFAEARRRDVPIFLSVGYSTCYWCHVMERESFEDERVAALLKNRFVSIKLDREERPDVDEIYMAAIQSLTGRGGWPMSVFLEPHALRPFWGGTYFPPRPAHGMPAFSQVLEGLSESWRTRRADVLKQAESVADAVRERLSANAEGAAHVGRPQVAMAVQTLLTTFDRVNGGFGGAPKFPQAVYLELLLDARERISDDGMRSAIDTTLRTTLDKMALGGIHDHVGGGFHRYSVDHAWIVPHFEKMLYDQAQMLSVYARASAIYGDAFYARAARRIASYVLREMTAPDGTFFTAQDAEVDGREGLNYLWTPAEVNAVLPAEDAAWAIEVLGLAGGPNFRDPHHPDAPPASVLRLGERPEATAARLGVSASEFVARLDGVLDRLLAARAKRKQARRDDKVLTGWNGMMIGGLALAGRVLFEPALVAAAERAASAILARHADADCTLRRTGDGPSTTAGVLEDYAWLTQGLIEIAEARTEDGDQSAVNRWLGEAMNVVGRAVAIFGDTTHGGFFDATSGEELFVRPRSTYDGAVPSPASIMLHNLIRLGEAASDDRLLELAAAGLAAVSREVAESPISTASSTRAILRMIEADEPVLVAALAARGAPTDGAVSVPTLSMPANGEAFEVHASADEVEVGPELPGEIVLRVMIRDGLHLTAADVGDGDASTGVVPLRVGIVGGKGLAAYADYPPGEPLDPADPSSPRVYRGTIEFPLAIEIAGEWAGTPRLALTAQACSDRECELPVTITLDVAITRVG